MSNQGNANQANKRVALICVAVVAGMTGLAFASAPLYDLFCRVTGFGGTPQRSAEAPGAITSQPMPGQMITVRFNSDTAPDMPWRFQPVQREVKVVPGEETLIFYRATNPTDKAITGTASFNVTPEKAGPYFDKIACFCFSEQVLEAGQSVDMPVSFFVDPGILKDPKTRDVKTITLSYTFFRKPGDTRLSDRQAGTAPAERAVN
ncbi:cytochrome c oxidase assembly protein [Ferrovibrio sp.]|uniref:cytochrome c oxidase assembly protein n=1 Tax=Ferrovibrio sp. TaxID=1917215 RepID=UPI001B7BECED|nr:cytochrome c oxidase assembly protein [Ferrovibrio sp.]MBP7064535.1 cytochrome c oxidase assembly protein [Ferrovibrio sp.]